MRSTKTVYKADGTPIEVVTVENGVNPLKPGQSAIPVLDIKKFKTVENAIEGLGPLVSSDSPTLVGNPEVPLLEDGK
jgi:hypothetical protein